MLLLLNTKITDYGLSHYDRAPHLPRYCRFDIFKYCLASYTALLPLVSKCVFFIELAPEYAHRQAELECYIRELYPNNLELHWYRNFYSRDWQKTCEQIITSKDELIWLACNDDHIFIDYGLSTLRAGLELLCNDPNPNSVIYYSHWPEQMRLAYHHNAQLSECGNYVKFNWRTFDSIRILKAERFMSYWFDQDFGDTPMFRTDQLYHIGHDITAPVYSPTKELVRHYDGYSHVSKRIVGISPPLVIPPGFFENDIKIRVGFDGHTDTHVTFNPLAEHLYAECPDGVDYRLVENDMPLFWKFRNTEIEINTEIDRSLLLDARDAAYLAATRVPMSCYGIEFDERNVAPQSWFKNHLRVHNG